MNAEAPVVEGMDTSKYETQKEALIAEGFQVEELTYAGSATDRAEDKLKGQYNPVTDVIVAEVCTYTDPGAEASTFKVLIRKASKTQTAEEKANGLNS